MANDENPPAPRVAWIDRRQILLRTVDNAFTWNARNQQRRLAIRRLRAANQECSGHLVPLMAYIANARTSKAMKIPFPGGARPVTDDPTDVGGTLIGDVTDATPEKERQFVQQAMSDLNCPSCGTHYWPTTTNSNYWPWEALVKAGMTPPDSPESWRAPGYGDLFGGLPDDVNSARNNPSSPSGVPPIVGRKTGCAKQ